MSVVRLTHPTRRLEARLTLDGSKSISNRALIALALSGADPAQWLTHLSTSEDTHTLQRLLAQSPDLPYDAGDGGTTFRFLTAYLATRPGTQVLTGTARMLQRPIGPLVDALRLLGADIRYVGKTGYPPLQIGPWQARPRQRPVLPVAADTSSQFLSALLLIGPCLPQGLELVPQGQLVSRPYVDMTLQLMQHFGAQAKWRGGHIVVEPGGYVPRALHIEADWSAASYWYAMAALSESVALQLEGLHSTSWQGDAVIAAVMEQRFGIRTTYIPDGIRLDANGAVPRPAWEYDFLHTPDLAQTMAVLCAGLGVHGLFSGLETLAIKETDRIAALRVELAKVGVSLARLPGHFSKKSPHKVFYALEGKARWGDAVPRFFTYGDHRMAMSVACLALLGTIEIEHPQVVSKSYPRFWADWQQTGGVLQPLERELG